MNGAQKDLIKDETCLGQYKLNNRAAVLLNLGRIDWRHKLRP
jgi:hypothetical protein